MALTRRYHPHIPHTPVNLQLIAVGSIFAWVLLQAGEFHIEIDGEGIRLISLWLSFWCANRIGVLLFLRLGAN